MMLVPDFKQYLETVPLTVEINFAGFCEPFLNPSCIDMIEYSVNKGYRTVLSTTLVNCTEDTAERLIKLPLKVVNIHLPDKYHNAHIPTTNEYKSVLMMVLQNMETDTNQMNDKFISNRQEDIARGTTVNPKRYPVTCDAITGTQYELLPNGDVYHCCCDKGLNTLMGNLGDIPYNELKKPSVQQYCKYCSNAKFTPLYYAIQMYNYLSGRF